MKWHYPHNFPTFVEIRINSFIKRQVFPSLTGSIMMTLLTYGTIQGRELTAAPQPPVLDTTEIRIVAERADEWTDLFKRSNGWFGGDGIYSIPILSSHGMENGVTTMFIFSDSLIGQLLNGKLTSSYRMINNSAAFLSGLQPNRDSLRFVWGLNGNDRISSLFVPRDLGEGQKDYYWLGDGFVNRELSKTYIFAYRMRNRDSGEEWSFETVGTELIAIPKDCPPPFKCHVQIPTPLHFNDGDFGACIFPNSEKYGAPLPDGYVYIYGVRGKAKRLMVARVKPKEFENFSKWRFWNGNYWDAKSDNIAYLADGVSNELSLSPIPGGKYVLTYQKNGIEPEIMVRFSDSPIGPFGPEIKVWQCEEAKVHNHFAYNAKAHPDISAPGELLVSYNVNAFNFNENIKKYPQLYRPRFIRLKFQEKN